MICLQKRRDICLEQLYFIYFASSSNMFIVIHPRNDLTQISTNRSGGIRTLGLCTQTSPWNSGQDDWINNRKPNHCLFIIFTKFRSPTSMLCWHSWFVFLGLWNHFSNHSGSSQVTWFIYSFAIMSLRPRSTLLLFDGVHFPIKSSKIGSQKSTCSKPEPKYLNSPDFHFHLLSCKVR